MKTEYETDFRKTTQEVLHSVMNRYKLKYDQKPVWQSIVKYLPADKDLCRNLRKHKADSIGNIPRGKDALGLQKILEGMLASGGDHVAAAEVYPIFERKERYWGVTKNVSPKIFSKLILTTWTHICRQAFLKGGGGTPLLCIFW